MKSRNPLAAILVAALLACGALSVVFAFVYSFGTRDLRRLQPQVTVVNTRLNLAQALLNDTLEYSKRNPAVDPILHSLKLKPVEATVPPGGAGAP